MYGMHDILLKNVDPEMKRRFKVHCAEVDITMKEGIIRLIEMDLENRLIAHPIKEVTQKTK